MKLMKIAMGAILLAGMTPLASGLAQGQTTEADISARMQYKPLFLMGLWAEDKLKFDAQGHPAGNYEQVPFTVCGMNITKVTLRGSHLKLEGEREGLIFNRNGGMKRIKMMVPVSPVFPREMQPEKMSVEIDNGKSKDFGPALDAIFTEDLKQLAPELPDFWQWYFRKTFGTQPTQVEPQAARPEAAKTSTVHIGGSVRAPKLLYSAEPDFSEYARRIKMSGDVQIYLWVDEEGIPSHVRVVKPLGVGLDEKAIAAVQQYRFSPATQDGKPVKVDLYINVNFQIF